MDKLLSPNSGENIERQMQLKEIDATLQAARERQIASARDRAIFRLHFQFGMSVRAIAQVSTFRLTSKGVESSLRRTVGMLKKTIGENSHRSQIPPDS